MRAYVFVTNIERFRDSHNAWKLRVVFTNSGKTPARHCAFWLFEGFHRNNGSPPSLPTKPPADKTKSIISLAPDGMTQFLNDSFSPSADQAALADMNMASLYVCGEIKYKDIFKKEHITKFRLVSNRGDLTQFSFTPEGNEDN